MEERVKAQKAWKTYPLFGSVRVECTECRCYATENTEADAKDALLLLKVGLPYCRACTVNALIVDNLRRLLNLRWTNRS